MYVLFLISTFGLIGITPFYFLSLEHRKLQKKYGKEKGIKIGKIFGLISGWGFFLFWIGIWVSPQPTFAVPILQNLLIFIPVVDFSVPLVHLLISVPFLAVGSWFGIRGVQKTTLEVAETHRTQKIVTTGTYAVVRHPQYLGGLLSHIGISFLLSAQFSLLLTPILIILIYILSRKEEKELGEEFGKEYENYKKKVPMLIPRLSK